MWSERLAPAYFSKGPGVAFAIRSSTAIFGATEFGVRFWSPLLARRHEPAALLFRAASLQCDGRLLGRHRVERTPIFNIGSFRHDDRSAFDFFLDWRRCSLSGSRWNGVRNFSWYWPLTGLLIGLGFLCKYTNALELVSIVLVLAARPAVAARIQASRILSALRHVRALHDSADHLEPATRLDHARASAIARGPGSRARVSSSRVAFVSRRAFPGSIRRCFFSGSLGR